MEGRRQVDSDGDEGGRDPGGIALGKLCEGIKDACPAVSIPFNGSEMCKNVFRKMFILHVQNGGTKKVNEGSGIQW